MIVVGIDPGPEESALVVLDTVTQCVTSARYRINLDLEADLAALACDHLGIEWIVTYQRAVGQAVFQTCRWVGRFEGASPLPRSRIRLLTTVDTRQNLCRTQKAGPREIRVALIDRFGATHLRAIGTKKQPGPLYELRTGPAGKMQHLWSALGIAVTLADRLREPVYAGDLDQTEPAVHAEPDRAS